MHLVIIGVKDKDITVPKYALRIIQWTNSDLRQDSNLQQLAIMCQSLYRLNYQASCKKIDFFIWSCLVSDFLSLYYFYSVSNIIRIITLFAYSKNNIDSEFSQRNYPLKRRFRRYQLSRVYASEVICECKKSLDDERVCPFLYSFPEGRALTLTVKKWSCLFSLRITVDSRN